MLAYYSNHPIKCYPNDLWQEKALLVRVYFPIRQIPFFMFKPFCRSSWFSFLQEFQKYTLETSSDYAQVQLAAAFIQISLWK